MLISNVGARPAGEIIAPSERFPNSPHPLNVAWEGLSAATQDAWKTPYPAGCAVTHRVYARAVRDFAI